MPETAFPTDEEDEPRAQSVRSPGGAPGQSLDENVSYDTGPDRWDPRRLHSGRGLMDSLRRGWAFVKEALAMALRDKDLLVPSTIAVFANLIVIAGLGGILHLTGDLGAVTSDDEAMSTAGYATLVVATLIMYIISYFFTGMTVRLIDVHLRGEDAKLGNAFTDVMKHAGGILSLAVASLVVSLIAGAVRGRSRGGMRRAAADTMQRGWMAITYLLLPVMILEDTSFMKSTGRAKSLHAHNVIQIVVGELGLMIGARVIGAVIISIAVIIAFVSFYAAPALLPIGVGVALLLIVLATAFNAYVRTAFYTCLYLWAVAMETVGEQAPAPAPLRTAFAVAS